MTLNWSESQRKMSRTGRYVDPKSKNVKLTKKKDYRRRPEQLGLRRGRLHRAGERGKYGYKGRKTNDSKYFT